MRFRFKERFSGFTIVEVLIVIVIIGVLAGITISYYTGSRQTAYLSRAKADLESIGNAAKLYANKNDTYPAEVSYDLPSGIKAFLSNNTQTGTWPAAPWPGSKFDYDAWDLDADGTAETIQISIRFCSTLSGPLNTCKFPKQPWVNGSWNVHSAVYYCVKGYCRPYSTDPYTYPGYCVNCPNNTAVKKPTE